MARSIRQNVAQLQLQHAQSPIGACVTLSFGIATLTPDRNRSPEILIKSADDALYHAKAQGRDRIVHCNHLPATAKGAIASDRSLHSD